MSSELALEDDTNDNILDFWSPHRNEFPTIATIARTVMAIPASNTAIEHLFSKSKSLISEKRTSLAVEKIDRLLFLKKNLNALKCIFNENSHEYESYATKCKENELANAFNSSEWKKI